MMNSMCTTIEVTKNIHDTGIMASWQPMSKSTTWQSWQKHWHVMMYWFMSRYHYKDILNNVIFAFKMSLLSERHLMTAVINMYKPYFIFMTYVMSCYSYPHPFK